MWGMEEKNTVLVLATNNAHKLEEIREILGEGFEVLGLADIGCGADIPETAGTLAGNAEQKARFVKENYGYDCLADDTGLMVDALGGEPGVYSARYAGPGHDSQANMKLLLEKLGDNSDRKAHFSTVIALIEGDEVRFFEGRVDGTIATGQRGESGFGYDPIFVPDETAPLTFAEVDPAAKNRISHRGRAVRKLAEYLKDRR